MCTRAGMAAQPLLGLRPRSAAAQLPAARVALVGTILALLAVASVPVWPTSVARRVAAVGGTAWLTVSGLIGAWSLAESDVALVPGLAVVAIPLALLIIGARWSENTLAPATLLATFGAVAGAVHLGARGSHVAVVAAVALPLPVAWPVLLVGAAAVAGARGRLRWDPLIVLVLAVVAVGWSVGSSVTVAIAAGTTAALSAWMTVGTELVRRRVALGLALVAGGLAVGAATDAMAVTVDVALGAGLMAVVLGSVAAVRFGPDTPPIVGPTVMGIATVATPTLASSMRASGLLLLVAAIGWLLLALVGPPHVARWAAAAVASVGSIALLADTGVEVVELYTVVPVLALGAAGSWWLIEDRAVRTLAALCPALIVALVPGLVVLASDPQVLGRTLGLTMVAGVLAFAGVRGHWLAPTLAGSGAAIGIAVTQLTIVVEVVPRWVTFAVVGALLVWLAATYEAQQARARRLGRYLHALR